MQYFGELRDNWRPLLAAAIGLGSGMAVVGPVTSTIVPNLIAEVGWSKATFAAVGSISILTSVSFPVIGRLVDMIGVRWTAFIGQALLPLIYFAYSMMNGEFWVYCTIFVIQALFCVTTTSTVYTRLVVQYITQARGLALAIVASGPAIVGLVLAPALNHYVEVSGWRAAYQAVAVFSLIAGLATFLLIPSHPHEKASPMPRAQAKPRAKEDYAEIFRSRAFWFLLVSMLLCNLPQTIPLVQLKMLMLANGVSGEGTGVMLSAMSLGMLAGRFVAGVALDRYNAHIVSFITLGLPSLGLYIIASSYDAPSVLTIAVFCVGFAFGAEGDIVAFLVARHFPVRIYGTVLGMLAAGISFSTASGAGLLSITMARTGGYDFYLWLVGTAVLAGSVLLLMLGKGHKPKAEEAARAIEEEMTHPGVPGTGQA